MFAIIFDSVGAGEWFVLLAVLLVVMGPQRLPSTMRKFGAYYSKFRRAAESFKRQLMEMDLELERAANEVRHEADDMLRVDEVDPPMSSGAVATGSDQTQAPAEVSGNGDQSH